MIRQGQIPFPGHLQPGPLDTKTQGFPRNFSQAGLDLSGPAYRPRVLSRRRQLQAMFAEAADALLARGRALDATQARGTRSRHLRLTGLFIWTKIINREAHCE